MQESETINPTVDYRRQIFDCLCGGKVGVNPHLFLCFFGFMGSNIIVGDKPSSFLALGQMTEPER